MKKFECNGCINPCIVETIGFPETCCFHSPKSCNWHEVTNDKPPKLTAAELDRRGIEWPDWAIFAATNAYGCSFFSSVKIQKTEFSWTQEGGSSKNIPGGWDASDWKNSLIQRPEKKLPDWCKVGAWVWTGNVDDDAKEAYFKIEKIENEYVFGVTPTGEKEDRHVCYCREARLRPWTISEWESKIGQRFRLSSGIFLLLGVADHDDGFYLDFSDCSGTPEALMEKENTLRQIDGSPCGVLEHFENGNWIH